MLTTIKGAIAKKNTNIGDVVAGGRGNPGKVTSKSEFSEDVSGLNNGNKTSKPTVRPAVNSSEPKGTKASRLREKLAQGAKQVFSQGSKGPEKKKQEKPEKIKHKGKNTLVSSTTMTIEQIQPRLENKEQKKPMELSEDLISERPIRPMTIQQTKYSLGIAIDKKSIPHIISIISNNDKTIESEIGSNNTEIIDLVDKAADVKDESQSKTAYAIAKEQEKKEFLAVVDNARAKLEEAKEQEKKEVPAVVDDARAKLEEAEEQEKEKVLVVVDDALEQKRSDSKPTESTTMTIEDIELNLKNLINKKGVIDDNTLHSIIYLVKTNDKTINEEIDSCNISIMELILQAAHNVQNKSTGETTHKIAKRLNISEFLDIVQNAYEKFHDLKKIDKIYNKQKKGCVQFYQDLFTLDDTSDEMYNEQEEGFIHSCPDLSILDDTSDEMYNEQKGNYVQSCPDLSTLHLSTLYRTSIIGDGLMQKYKKFDTIHYSTRLQFPDEGETSAEIVEESGNKETDSKSLEESVRQLEREADNFRITMEGSQIGNKTKTEPQTPTESPILSKNLDEPKGVSGDSGMGSPEPNPAAPALGASLQKQPDDEQDSGIDSPKKKSGSKEYEEKMRLNHPTKTRSKRPSRQRPPSKYHNQFLGGTEDNTHKKELPLNTEKVPEQVTKEQEPAVIPVPDAEIQEDQNKIPASRAGMTLTSSEKPEVPIKEELEPVIILVPEAAKDQIKKEPTPAVVRVADTRIKEEQNMQIPVSSTQLYERLI
ncbi:hypothetical protein [Wolbachia endosymbiont of Folsomia candida]|uniref:hypothetical protein n=1 Tax=Wolbachia endosymbiont of Folsomia candida TaxID=169402 RepID=UPI000A8DD1EB|nr:hypothetical protein [Wolbachia endosymbiont of Folsomia candida]APR98750.1 hypothetical protein ASM33_05940 [Wolbachia endosymbiont of Folsomia candida]